MCSGKSDRIRAMWFYSGKSGCIRAKAVLFRKVVLFGQKWLYSGKSGSIRAKVVVFGQSGCIRAVLLYLSKSGCNRAKVVVLKQKRLCSGKSGCLPEYWLYSGKVVVFG